MVRNTNGARLPRLAFVGFGEAAQAFVQGLGPEIAKATRAFDIKTDHSQAAIRDAKWADYEVAFVTGCAVLPEALGGHDALDPLEVVPPSDRRRLGEWAMAISALLDDDTRHLATSLFRRVALPSVRSPS